jgi:hypothetical protein
MSTFRSELTAEVFNGRSRGHLPGLVGLQILTMSEHGVERRLEMRKDVPDGALARHVDNFRHPCFNPCP